MADITSIKINNTVQKVTDTYASGFASYANPIVNQVADVKTEVANIKNKVDASKFLTVYLKYEDDKYVLYFSGTNTKVKNSDLSVGVCLNVEGVWSNGNVKTSPKGYLADGNPKIVTSEGTWCTFYKKSDNYYTSTLKLAGDKRISNAYFINDKNHDSSIDLKMTAGEILAYNTDALSRLFKCFYYESGGWFFVVVATGNIYFDARDFLINSDNDGTSKVSLNPNNRILPDTKFLYYDQNASELKLNYDWFKMAIVMSNEELVSADLGKALRHLQNHTTLVARWNDSKPLDYSREKFINAGNNNDSLLTESTVFHGLAIDDSSRLVQCRAVKDYCKDFSKYTTKMETAPFLMGKSRYITRKIVAPDGSTQPIEGVINPLDYNWLFGSWNKKKMELEGIFVYNSITWESYDRPTNIPTLPIAADSSFIVRDGTDDNSCLICNLVGICPTENDGNIINCKNYNSKTFGTYRDSHVFYSEPAFIEAPIIGHEEAAIAKYVGISPDYRDNSNARIVALRLHVFAESKHNYEIYAGFDPIGEYDFSAHDNNVLMNYNIEGTRYIVRPGETKDYHTIFDNNNPISGYEETGNQRLVTYEYPYCYGSEDMQVNLDDFIAPNYGFVCIVCRDKDVTIEDMQKEIKVRLIAV